VNAGPNHHNKLLLHYKLIKYAVNQTGKCLCIMRAQIWIKRWAVCRTKAGCTAHWSIRQLPYRTLLVLIKPRSLTITDSPKHEPNYGKCQATGATLSPDHLGTTSRPHPSAHQVDIFSDTRIRKKAVEAYRLHFLASQPRNSRQEEKSIRCNTQS
jgi:hypothetical protein